MMIFHPFVPVGRLDLNCSPTKPKTVEMSQGLLACAILPISDLAAWLYRENPAMAMIQLWGLAKPESIVPSVAPMKSNRID
jgi:hypothetical protein